MSAELVHEELKTFVSDLKAAREAKGLSLKNVHEKTRISVTILDALEKGEFHLLPPDVYTRNFIRNYAEFLEVDSKPILDSFKDEKEYAAPPVLQKETMETLPSSERHHWKHLVLGVSVFFFIGVLVWLLVSYADKSILLKSSGSGERERTASSGEAPVGANSGIKDVATLPSSTKPLPETTNTFPPQAAEPDHPQASSSHEAAGPYTLIIEAKEKTWLRIRTDDEEATERTMKPGERLDLSARERFTLDIGNAAGVRVLFQDRLLENLGEEGQVVHLSLP
ncbi:protein of unknown function [Syntrophus gentianae]|uniref:Cytoskeleton protein RodZ-like C-terminal domain-containing protein n=1 Tax=Syntrophus gentianae TaxID=43775 RepID=A0A1H7W920_9BACT|nr:helix-turn-helix domain-containing protein [Syntrophus gentianae]SEM18003.1 protein of unknown function [Syntrophus gentianae]